MRSIIIIIWDHINLYQIILIDVKYKEKYESRYRCTKLIPPIIPQGVSNKKKLKFPQSIFFLLTVDTLNYKNVYYVSVTLPDIRYTLVIATLEIANITCLRPTCHRLVRAILAVHMTIAIPRSRQTRHRLSQKATGRCCASTLKLVLATRLLPWSETAIGLIWEARTVIDTVTNSCLIQANPVQRTFELASWTREFRTVLFVIVVAAVIVTVAHIGLVNTLAQLAMTFELCQWIALANRTITLVWRITTIILRVT